MNYRYKCCDILFAELRTAHFNSKDDELFYFIQCHCKMGCSDWKFKDIPNDSIEMKINLNIVIDALKPVSSTVLSNMIAEIKYLSKNYKSLKEAESVDPDRKTASIGDAGVEGFLLIILFVMAIVGLFLSLLKSRAPSELLQFIFYCDPSV